MGNEQEKPHQKDTRDLMSVIREKSMRDVLMLSLKRGPLGGYKAEDVVAYSRSVMEQWSVCEKNYNDYIKDLYQQIESLQGDLKNKSDAAEDRALEQRFMLFQDEVNAQIDELIGQKAELCNQLESAQNKLQLLSAQFDAQTLELNELNAQNERLKADLQSPVQSAEDELYTAQEALQLNDLLTALENLQAQEAKLLELIGSLEAEKASLQSANNDLSNENKNLTSEISSLNNENEALKAQIEQLQGSLSGFDADAAQLQHTIEALAAEKEESQQTLNVLSAQTAGLQSANEALHAQLAQFQELRAENTQFKLLVEELNAQYAALENNHNLAMEQVQEAQDHLQTLMQDNVALKIALDSKGDAHWDAPENALENTKEAQLVSLANGNKELISTIKELDAKNKELHYQINFIKESFVKVLHLENEKQLENEQLQQLLSIERSRIRQLVRESWKTSIWNEIDSMLM